MKNDLLDVGHQYYNKIDTTEFREYIHQIGGPWVCYDGQ